MDYRMDLENNRRHFDFVRVKQSVGSNGASLEEFGMEEEFHIPKKKENPSIRERHDQFLDNE